MLNSIPTLFPEKNAAFLLEGPVGQLEVHTAAPIQISTPATVVIICHPHSLHGGTLHNKVVSTLSRAFLHLGMYTMRFNFRGVGASAGAYDEGIGETDDLLTVIHWVKQCLPMVDLWLAGFSFGSYVAARTTALTSIDNLISIAPPVHHFAFDEIPAFETPWLVVQGDADEVVPPESVFAWAKARHPAPKLHVMTAASHFFHGRLVELHDYLLAQYRR